MGFTFGSPHCAGVTRGSHVVHLTLRGSPGVSMWFSSLYGGQGSPGVPMWFTSLCRRVTRGFNEVHFTVERVNRVFHVVYLTVWGSTSSFNVVHLTVWGIASGCHVVHLTVQGSPGFSWGSPHCEGSRGVSLWFSSLCGGHLGFPCSSPHCVGVTRGFHGVHLTVQGSPGVSM